MKTHLILVLCNCFSKYRLPGCNNTTQLVGLSPILPTSDPVAFVNLAAKGTLTGAATDFDGKFKIVFSPPADSFVVPYIGYQNKPHAILPKQAEQFV